VISFSGGLMAKEEMPILKLMNVSKTYPGVVALHDVSMEVTRGEIHALVGENGAGKSTLVKCCSGAIKPSHGTVVINGEEFQSLTPQLSEKKGLSVIYQEFNLIQELTVAENVFLGRAIRKGIVIDKKAMAEETRRIFSQLHIKINPNQVIKNLTVGYQQMVEIAKALSIDAKILFMDEPTAPLTKTETEDLFRVIRKLKESGVTIIYISHRLEEIFHLCDRVTVMRDGEIIKTLDTDETNKKQLIELMVGRVFKETFPPRASCIEKEVVLDVKNLSGNGVKDITFQVRRGEILGLGGLIGAGRTELAELLFGVKPIKSGSVFLNNKEIHYKDPENAIKKGIAYVSEDRKQKGALLDVTIRENITIAIQKRISKCFVINRNKETTIAEKYKKQLGIKAPSIYQLVKNLSGGNQQKVVLAKWLASEPELIILDEPTRGIDVGAKYEIYKLINELVMQKKAVIMISSEMEELIGVSDRIIVLSEGLMTGELLKPEFNQERILEFASANAGESKV
jgi:ribose transport system ATP-binding protein